MTQEIEQVEAETVSVTACADCGAFGWCECADKPLFPTKHQGFVTGLRALADFYEKHGDLELPQYFGNFTIYSLSAAQLPKYAKAFGSLQKHYDESSFQLKKDFGGGVVLATYSTRDQVCERVEVGEEEVPEHVIPAQAETVVPAHKVKKYEWKCPDSLLKPQEAALVSSSDDMDMPF